MVLLLNPDILSHILSRLKLFVSVFSFFSLFCLFSVAFCSFSVLGFNVTERNETLNFLLNLSETPFLYSYNWTIELSPNSFFTFSAYGDFVDLNVTNQSTGNSSRIFNFETFVVVPKVYIPGNYSGRIAVLNTNTGGNLSFLYNFFIRSDSSYSRDDWIMLDLNAKYRDVCIFDLPLSFGDQVSIQGPSGMYVNLTTNSGLLLVPDNVTIGQDNKSVVPINITVPRNLSLGEHHFVIFFRLGDVLDNFSYFLNVKECILHPDLYTEYLQKCHNITTFEQLLECKLFEEAMLQSRISEIKELINFTDGPHEVVKYQNKTEYVRVWEIDENAMDTLTGASRLADQLEECNIELREKDNRILNLSHALGVCNDYLLVLPDLVDKSTKTVTQNQAVKEAEAEKRKDRRRNWIIFGSICLIFGTLFYYWRANAFI